MKEVTTYEACQLLRRQGLFTLAQNAEYWATRADYLTIYEYILIHFPDRPYGYQVKTANALSFNKLGGGYCGILAPSDIRRAVQIMESTVYL